MYKVMKEKIGATASIWLGSGLTALTLMIGYFFTDFKDKLDYVYIKSKVQDEKFKQDSVSSDILIMQNMKEHVVFKQQLSKSDSISNKIIKILEAQDRKLNFIKSKLNTNFPDYLGYEEENNNFNSNSNRVVYGMWHPNKENHKTSKN